MNLADVLKNLKEAEELVLNRIDESDQVGRDMLSTGAVDYLSKLSSFSRYVSEECNGDLKLKYQEIVQGLIDFLEEDDFANLLKESDAIEDIYIYFPSIRVPNKYKEQIEPTL